MTRMQPPSVTQERLRRIQAEIDAGVRALQPALDTPPGQQQMANFLAAKARETQSVIEQAQQASTSSATAFPRLERDTARPLPRPQDDRLLARARLALRLIDGPVLPTVPIMFQHIQPPTLCGAAWPKRPGPGPASIQVPKPYDDRRTARTYVRVSANERGVDVRRRL